MISEGEYPAAGPLGKGWLSLEQLASACEVETDWLLARLRDGLLPGAESVDGLWRFPDATRFAVRIRRMRGLEQDFDAVPELAALVADFLEELDRLRAQQCPAG